MLTYWDFNLEAFYEYVFVFEACKATFELSSTDVYELIC